jgi:hypothetical protein
MIALAFLVFLVVPLTALVLWALYFIIRKAVAHGILDAERARGRTQI